MLIPAAQQNATNVAAYTQSVTPSGVERELARADIPPVEEAEKSAGGQNQFFSQTLPTPLTKPSGAPSDAPAAGASDGSQAEASAKPATDSSADRNTTQSVAEQGLAEEDLALIEQLRARDREVRVHEAAHASVGGRYAGSAKLEYTRGPDGKNYATGGEVSISTGAVPGDPQATIEKARVIRAAALAPAEPSTQDRRVAAEASQLELSARADLQALQAEEAQKEEEARAEREQKAKADDVEEPKPEETQEPVAAPVVVATESAEDPKASEDKEAGEAAREPRLNARQELEKILLGSTGLLQQANQQGLVDPQNPYGKSGFLDVIA